MSTDYINQTHYALAKQLPDIQRRGLVAQTAYGELSLSEDESKAVARAIEKALTKRLDKLEKLEKLGRTT